MVVICFPSVSKRIDPCLLATGVEPNEYPRVVHKASVARASGQYSGRTRRNVRYTRDAGVTIKCSKNRLTGSILSINVQGEHGGKMRLLLPEENVTALVL